MKNRILTSAALLLVLITAIFQPREAMAALWVTDNIEHWTVDLVCRDGAIALAYDINSGAINGGGLGDGMTVSLTAHRLPDNFFAMAGYVMSASESVYYGQHGKIKPIGPWANFDQFAIATLGDEINLDLEPQPTPLFVDFGNGDLVSDYEVGFQEWDTLLPVGSLVAVARGNGPFIVSPVADCRLPSDGHVWRVSVTDSGIEGNGDSAESSLSAHGMRIAFRSDANNLAISAIDDNDSSDIYLHTLATDETQLLSIDGSPTEPQAGGGASHPDISYSGDRVVFASDRVLFTFDGCTFPDSDGASDVFEWDYTLPPLRRSISVFRDASGAFCNTLDEANFHPAINNIDVVFTTDTPLFLPSDRMVLDRNEAADILRLDNRVDGTSVVSADMTLRTGNGRSDYAAIATLGNWVAYETTATDLVADNNGAVSDIVLTDSDALTHQLISVSTAGTQSDGASNRPSISALATHIAFDSVATNLATGAPNGVRQVYVRSLDTGCTTLLSQTTGGDIGGGDSQFASISADGRFVVFQSDASNLVPNDTNQAADIFLVDRDADENGLFYGSAGCSDVGRWSIQRISVTAGGLEANGNSAEPDISANGAYVSFTSDATNLVDSDTNDAADIFVTFVGYPSLDSTAPLAIQLNGAEAARFEGTVAIAVNVALFIVVVTIVHAVQHTSKLARQK